MIDEHESESSDASQEPEFTSKLSPREIQQRVRNGESVESLAHAAGAPLPYVERFAAPIYDELEHMLEMALSTPVITAAHQEDDSPQTFGSVIHERLRDSYQAEPEWAIWKDLLNNHWIVQLKFELNDEEVDARWHYEPRKQLLSANNNAAINISSSPNPRQVDPIIPTTEDAPGNVTRFDSGAFQPDLTQFDTVEMHDPVEYGRSEDTEAVITELYRKPEPQQESDKDSYQQETEELLDELDQLRGKRVEQEPLLTIAEYEDIELPLEDFQTERIQTRNSSSQSEDLEDDQQEDQQSQKSRENSRRRGRQQVPSWDEIVFGTRPEDS